MKPNIIAVPTGGQCEVNNGELMTGQGSHISVHLATNDFQGHSKSTNMNVNYCKLAGFII